MADRNKCTLQELTISINTGLDAIRRAPIIEKKTDIRCLRIQDISQCKSFEKWGYTEVIKKDFEKFQLITDDIIMARTCSTGICYLVKENIPAVFNNGLARIRLDKEKAYPQFMYYVFKSKHFTDYIDGISRGTSVQLNMKIGDLEKYEFHLPSLENQKKIAYILGKYDDKIHLNTQTNQTLEAIAQAIFKSWFVNFDPVRAKAAALSEGKSEHEANLAAMSVICGKDTSELNDTEYKALWQIAEAFPSELVENEQFGEVPKGWEITTFGEVSECFDRKRIPLSKKQREEKKGTIPYYGATSIMDYVNEAIFDDIYLLVGEDGSVLREDGTPFIQYIWGKSWVNNHAHVLQGKNGISTEHLMTFIRTENISAYVTGAVQMKLNQANMNRIPFLKANNKINIVFDCFLKSIYLKFRNNIEENQILAQTRDLLLPKLLSGEIHL
ncbi:type I restriction enzyme S subunit [Bibersteinia trehalosi]|uniref:restriction endonuclease subunit S n=1 Tax=Bibersteinia trehalosi TaxID=47735 RepID=UPI0010F0F060|nr:restriction endonuclease subunit S [Bibersteinia trehalosi]TCT18663.1 type I restriction enzyme S subunit [Bibersteinia trehalosi]